jgi:hypothetical protein
LATARNGLRFDNRYCWVVHFAGGTIDEVRAYLDSVMVARLFEENPIYLAISAGSLATPSLMRGRDYARVCFSQGVV